MAWHSGKMFNSLAVYTRFRAASRAWYRFVSDLDILGANKDAALSVRAICPIFRHRIPLHHLIQKHSHYFPFYYQAPLFYWDPLLTATRWVS